LAFEKVHELAPEHPLTQLSRGIPAARPKSWVSAKCDEKIMERYNF